MSRVTPSSSNITRPGFTTATHISGDPLPLPMRVSAGFFVIGLSGEIRIHTLPPPLMCRESAPRAPSIWRLVAPPRSLAPRPHVPEPHGVARPPHPLLPPLDILRDLPR